MIDHSYDWHCLGGPDDNDKNQLIMKMFNMKVEDLESSALYDIAFESMYLEEYHNKISIVKNGRLLLCYRTTLRTEEITEVTAFNQGFINSWILAFGSGVLCPTEIKYTKTVSYKLCVRSYCSVIEEREFLNNVKLYIL